LPLSEVIRSASVSLTSEAAAADGGMYGLVYCRLLPDVLAELRAAPTGTPLG
jgi:hypothetical protein